MAQTSLEFGIVPLEDTFTPTLEGISARAIDIAPCYEALHTAFRRIEQRRFDREGPGWAELAPSTVADRARQGLGPHPILDRKGGTNRTYAGRRAGQLRTSLTTKSDKNSVIEPQVDGVFFGTKDPIAKYHQDGTDKMPARTLVDLTEADAQIFGSIIGEWVYGYKVESTTFAATAGAI